MKKDWHALLPSNYREQIEWCSDGTVRAKYRNEIGWRYGHSTNAQYALSKGYELLRKEK